MRVLLLTFQAGGNVPPFVEVGRELRRRGHDVTCLAQKSLRDVIERAGIAFRPIEHGIAYSAFEPQTPEQETQRFLDLFMDHGYGTDLRVELEREPADLVVLDCYLFGAMAVAEAIGQPYAVLVHTTFEFMQALGGALLPIINQCRGHAGLAPAESIREVWERAGRVVVGSCAPLDAEPLADAGGVRYVGPIFQAADGTPTPHIPPGSDPLVLVACSTTFMQQHDVIQRAINALGELPVRALLTTGPALDADSLRTPDNVTVQAWTPHASVLPECSLVVCHGGHGTVSAALHFGIPTLCLPLGRDQAFIAQRIAELGVGLTLNSDAGHNELLAAIAALLDDSPKREAARAVGESIRAHGVGAANAATELEAWAGTASTRATSEHRREP